MGKLQFHLRCIKFICCNFMNMWDRLSIFFLQSFKSVLRYYLPQHAKDLVACPASVCTCPGFWGEFSLTKVVIEHLSTWKWHGSGYGAWGWWMGKEKDTKQYFWILNIYFQEVQVNYLSYLKITSGCTNSILFTLPKLSLRWVTWHIPSPLMVCYCSARLIKDCQSTFLL